MKQLITFLLGASLSYGLLRILFGSRAPEKNPFRLWSGDEALEPTLDQDVYNFGAMHLDRVSPRKFIAVKFFQYPGAEVPSHAGELVDEGTHLVATRVRGDSKTFDPRDLKDAAKWMGIGVPKPGYFKAAAYTGSLFKPMYR